MRRYRGGGSNGSDETAKSEVAVGKRTLTSRLPVQRKASAAPTESTRMAADSPSPASSSDDPFGVHLMRSSAGEPLPDGLRERAEASTGADLSAVRVHTGPASQDAAAAIGARAYTHGNDIHFGAGEYQPGTHDGDLLAAHEIAHTVQQRGSATTQFKFSDDDASPSEVEADRAAVAIVADTPATITAAPTAIARKKKRPAATRPADHKTKDDNVERSGTVSNAYGTFTYKITKKAAADGCEITLKFNAFTPEVDASKITIIQTIQQVQGGSTVFYLNNDVAYYSPFDVGDGTYTDHLQGETDPFYNFKDKTSTDESTWKTDATESTMTDGPRTKNSRGERFVNFETAPFALSGKDKGEFFGTFTWGYAVDSAGTFTLRDAQAHDDITTGFGAALRKFIAHQGDLTKTGTTPAPIQLELPINARRDLTAAEKALLDPFVTFAKAAANATARVWMTSRYDSSGFGAEANHVTAMDNLKGVQKYLTDKGVNLDKIRIAATEEAASPKKNIGIVDVTIINT